MGITTMALQEYEKRLLEFLVAEFEACHIDSDDPIAKTGKEIVQLYKDQPDSLSRSHIFKLDMIMLHLQPTERLLQRADTLRLKYMELAGAKMAAVYRPPQLPPLDQFDEAARRLLLADLQNVLQFIHWSYFFTPIRESIRNSIVRWAAGAMAFYTSIWLAGCWFFLQIGRNFYATLLTVVYAGVMGGFISSQRRMQMIPIEGDPLASIYALENGRNFYWLAPLMGAVFAVVLMLMFQSGIIESSIFPKFAIPKISNSQVAAAESVGPIPASSKTQKFVLPVNSTDYALLFLWCFLAGFAERFVPDALDRLISRTDAFSKAPPPPPAARTEGIAPLPKGVGELAAPSGEIKRASPADSKSEAKDR
jgi:hypothetical protein